MCTELETLMNVYLNLLQYMELLQQTDTMIVFRHIVTETTTVWNLDIHGMYCIAGQTPT